MQSFPSSIYFTFKSHHINLSISTITRIPLLSPISFPLFFSHHHLNIQDFSLNPLQTFPKPPKLQNQSFNQSSIMANDEADDQESKKLQYPLDPNSYHLLDEIGRGLNAVVYKATCIPLDSTPVAIKSIDLDRSRADLENVRREAKTMSLLSHPNILRAHCSFTVDRRLWVVMPFMSAGSFQSIISSAFPSGLPEPCIAVILREALMGLSYLHDQGHLHRDIKSGNILIDSNGSIKLADFGVSASVYESINPSCFILNDVAGTPYWMAPEVIHSHTGYSYKADIWSFGITALELAHGRPPLSHLPFSKSILMKITKRFRFSDYQKSGDSSKNRKFSKAFKDMVGLCLDQDPSKRPSAEKLLKHPFFKNCKGSDFLVKNVLHGLPSVEQRFREVKLQRLGSMSKSDDGDDDGGVLLESNVKERRISGWNFNLEGFELDPVFPIDKSGELDDIVKQVRFGGDSVILEKAGESDASTASSPGQVMCRNEIGGGCGGGGGGGGGGVDKERVMGTLMALKKSMDDQRENVMSIIGLVGGEAAGVFEVVSREEQLIQVIEKLKMELEIEKRKNSDLILELEFLKLQVTSGSE